MVTPSLDVERHVVVRSRLAVGREPEQAMGCRVERRAAGQMVGPVDQGAAVGVGGGHREDEGLALLTGELGRQWADHRRRLPPCTWIVNCTGVKLPWES